MSFDLSAPNRSCDHLVILERYVIDPFDFRTLHYASDSSLNMRAPINAPSMVRLYIKDSLVHPNDPRLGYSVVPDPDRIQIEGVPFSKIVFNKPVRLRDSLIQVSYLTRQQQCPKCGGFGNIIDWGVSPTGGLNYITGERKLGQQAIKYILTSKNPFSRNLVCPVRTYVGRKFGFSITEQDISTAINQALVAYQAIQRAQKTVQTMTPNEMIKDVVSVASQQDPEDPTRVYVAIELTAYGTNETIPLNVALQSV